MNGLVGHHEAFAEIGLGSSAHLRGGVLDFTNDKASSVPVGAEWDRGRRKRWVEKKSREDVSQAE